MEEDLKKQFYDHYCEIMRTNSTPIQYPEYFILSDGSMYRHLDSGFLIFGMKSPGTKVFYSLHHNQYFAIIGYELQILTHQLLYYRNGIVENFTFCK